MTVRKLVLTCLLVSAFVHAQDSPDVTDDGLVRVPSSRKAGVYRAPGVSFFQYEQIEFGPITVQFRKSWERNARQSDHLSTKQLDEIRNDLARSFHDELYRELVKRGGYRLASSPSTDSLRITASVLNLEISAPEAAEGQRSQTLVRSAGSMKLQVEMRDAATGAVVARIIQYYQAPEYDIPKLATKISNAADFRIGFADAALHTHEALNVAKSEKREDQSQIQSEN